MPDTDAVGGPWSGGDAADMTGWESALLVLVPEADPVVSVHRARLDLSARDGVPAHLTVLYPFLPPDRIGAADLLALKRLFAGVASFEFMLDRVSWFGDAVAWLGLHDEEPFRALTRLVCAAYPSCLPYGGRHDDVVPHLTIGHLGGPQALRVAADAVRPQLPVTARAAEVTLMAGPSADRRDAPARWSRLATFPMR